MIHYRKQNHSMKMNMNGIEIYEVLSRFRFEFTFQFLFFRLVFFCLQIFLMIQILKFESSEMAQQHTAFPLSNEIGELYTPFRIFSVLVACTVISQTYLCQCHYFQLHVFHQQAFCQANVICSEFALLFPIFWLTRFQLAFVECELLLHSTSSIL